MAGIAYLLKGGNSSVINNIPALQDNGVPNSLPEPIVIGGGAYTQPNGGTSVDPPYVNTTAPIYLQSNLPPSHVQNKGANNQPTYFQPQDSGDSCGCGCDECGDMGGLGAVKIPTISNYNLAKQLGNVITIAPNQPKPAPIDAHHINSSVTQYQNALQAQNWVDAYYGAKYGPTPTSLPQLPNGYAN